MKPVSPHIQILGHDDACVALHNSSCQSDSSYQPSKEVFHLIICRTSNLHCKSQFLVITVASFLVCVIIFCFFLSTGNVYNFLQV